MDIITLDFETYFAKDYSLRRKGITTESYIRDPRFEVLGVGVSRNGAEPIWVPGPQVAAWLRMARPLLEKSAVLAHHAHFDGFILSHHYGIHPKFFLCTMSMARGKGFLQVGLEAVCEELGLPPKGEELESFKGKHWDMLSTEEQETLGKYCTNDVRITWLLWEKLKEGFPVHELRTIDQVVRMFTQPRIILDPEPLKAHLVRLGERRQALLESVGGDEETALKTLRSNQKFADLLRSYGVTPPMKEGKNGPTYAFAKTDEGIKSLLAHPDERVQIAVAARLGVKSSIDETRCRHFLDLAERGAMPVYLYYAGAQTTNRLSGGDKQNLQNLPKKDKATKQPHPIRRAITAPAGYRLVVADSAQIEARVLAWLAGQDNVVEAFAQGRDVYSEAASRIYRRQVDRKNNPEDKQAGDVGKTATLSMGYGVGFIKAAASFLDGPMGANPIIFTEDDAAAMGVSLDAVRFDKRKMVRIAETQPPTLSQEQWLLQCAVCDAIVTRFRDANPRITALWDRGDTALRAIANGSEIDMDSRGVVKTVPYYGLRTACGVTIRYDQLQQDEEGWKYWGRKEGRLQWIRLYGGKVVENVCQHLAAAIIREQMLRIGERYPVLFQVHDEIVFLAREEEADEALAWALGVMRIAPSWAPNLPLNAEGDHAANYGDAK